MSGKTVALIAGGALTAVGLGVGIGFTVAKSGAQDDADKLREDSIAQVGKNGCATQPDTQVCTDLRNANDKVDKDGTLATVGFISAGVFAAGTVATYFLWPEESKAEGKAVRLVPQLGPGHAGLLLNGRF